MAEDYLLETMHRLPSGYTVQVCRGNSNNKTNDSIIKEFTT